MCDLAGFDLQGKVLPGLMVGANVSRANLRATRCGEEGIVVAEDVTPGIPCHFECGDLRGADLSDAYFIEPIFGGARLCGARLIGAGLWNADFRHADLRDVDFTRAHLEEAIPLTICPSGQPGPCW
jgi:uncharacterized protein YjbI with pentapeptide repeats